MKRDKEMRSLTTTEHNVQTSAGDNKFNLIPTTLIFFFFLIDKIWPKAKNGKIVIERNFSNISFDTKRLALSYLTPSIRISFDMKKKIFLSI